MKTTVITCTPILCFVLGIALPAPCLPSQQGEKEDHPQKQQSQKEQAKPQQQLAQQRPDSNPATRQAQQAKQKQTTKNQQQRQPDKNNQHAQQPQQSDKSKSQPARGQSQTRQDKNDRARQPQQNGRPQEEYRRGQTGVWQQHRAQHWQLDHRTWNQRGGYRGYRIPDDRFVGYFGPKHGFRIFSLPTLVVGGYQRFQYGGYWFSLVDPWPEYWSDDWYEKDDVYIVYTGDGYYLFNRRYPGVGIAVSISM